jgi:hypothetical protein
MSHFMTLCFSEVEMASFSRGRSPPHMRAPSKTVLSTQES